MADPKDAHPRILLVDLPPRVRMMLSAADLNIACGTFGHPFEVAVSDSYVPVVPDADLPRLAEQDIVVVDLAINEVKRMPAFCKSTSDETPDWYEKCNRGVIDPRPVAMHKVREVCAAILRVGGVFIVFAHPREQGDRYFGTLRTARASREKQPSVHNWSLFSRTSLADLAAHPASGRDITVASTGHPLEGLLRRYAGTSEFRCTIGYSLNAPYCTHLATDRFGKTIALALRVPHHAQQPGLVLILPDMQPRLEFLRDLLRDVLPDMVPHLYPGFVGNRWVHQPEYELPNVVRLRAEIADEEQQSRQRVAGLEAQIDEEMAADGWMYDLIRGTDNELKRAVARALGILGFSDLVDSDEEQRSAGKQDDLLEDLRIENERGVLLVETKGIGGQPSDEDALQVQKYLPVRMHEWDRTNICGLSIINAQRHIAPLARDNEHVFRDVHVLNAKKLGIGLVSAWELLRLVRSFIRNGWKHEFVRDIFYQAGVLELVPSHYHYLGAVAHSWPDRQAIGVDTEDIALRVGDRISLQSRVEYLEYDVESLMVDGAAVEECPPHSKAGIKTRPPMAEAKEGTPVYRVNRQ